MQLNFKKWLRMQSECLSWQGYQILKFLYRSVPPKVTYPSQNLFHIYFIQKGNNITGRIQFCLRNIQRHEMGKGIKKRRGKDFLCFSNDDLNESGVSVTCQRISAWAYYLVIECTIVCHVQSFIDYLFLFACNLFLLTCDAFNTYSSTHYSSVKYVHIS